MPTRSQWFVVALLASGLVAAGLLGTLPGGLTGALQAGLAEDAEASQPASADLIRPHDGESYLWPYTSRTPDVRDRTLALNVVVQGDPERTRRALANRSGANWTTVDGNETLGESPWGPARGSPRYTYVTTDRNESGQWTVPAYQLAVGDYLGGRTHVRAYTMPPGNWTALQTHTEYWDWFRLRHTVTGVDQGGRFVERDLRDQPFVAEVSREYHGLTGGGSDGWVTVIRLDTGARLNGSAVTGGPSTAPRMNAVDTGPRRTRPAEGSGRESGVDVATNSSAVTTTTGAASDAAVSGEVSTTAETTGTGTGTGTGTAAEETAPGAATAGLESAGVATAVLVLLVGATLPAARRRWTASGAALPVALAALAPGVRVAGVAAETLSSGVDPHLFAGLLYPVLALGPLAVVAALGRNDDPSRAAVLAAAGFGVGLAVDMTVVGVDSIPVSLAIHRVSLVAALAVVAHGVASGDRRRTAAGVLGWVLLLVGALVNLF